MFRVCRASVRFKSTLISNNSIYVISIPITTSKSYIYCHQKPSFLHESQAKNIPFLIKFENRIINLATNAWNKLVKSDKSYNVKIVNLVTKLLATIPYEENCLKSFPLKSAMIREINSDSLPQSDKSETFDNAGTSPSANSPSTMKILHAQIENKSISATQLQPIPLYHPSFQNPTIILNQLYSFRDNAYKHHYKYSWLCAIGIPLTLPVALIPVLPNVPGLYLAYRLYCNIKALQGINHLNYLLETTGESKNIINDTNHLKFTAIDPLDTFYKDPLLSDKELVIISEEIIDNLVTNLQLPHLKNDLLKAMKQESKRIEQLQK